MNANETVAKPGRAVGTQSPSVVLTLPFDPKMSPRSQVEATLKDALTRAVHRLMEAYPRDIAVPVINKLEDLACNINYATHKRSIALFVSTETEKILYLDEALEEQVLIDSGFRIRDLSIPHPSHVQYYLLLLSGRLSKMYLGDNHRLQLIKSNKYRDMGQGSADEGEGEDKFLYHMDEGLTSILDGHPLPVFVLATPPVAEHFARITRNDRNIGVYIHKDCLEFSEDDLLDLLQPYFSDWANIRQKMTLKHIAIAEGAGKIECGIEAVSKAVHAGNHRLLIVERGFTAPGAPSDQFFTRDRVDALIEKVLERGGQVEWVGKGELQSHAHIILVRYH